MDYPLEPKRIEQHLKQIVLNIQYEYQDGRLSALNLLTLVTTKFSTPLLQEHYQLLFLPMVL